MATVTDKIVIFCRKNGLILETQEPWLRYGLEKRFSTLIGLVPFVILAVFLTNFFTAISFICSFCALRSRINGYHANTQAGCLFVSLGLELICLLGAYPLLSVNTAIVLICVCSYILILVAPYNHPNMHLSDTEIDVLKIHIKRIVLLLWFLSLIFGFLQIEDITKGLATGVFMATIMLCMAYIQNGGYTNEQNTGKGKICSKNNDL